MLQQTQSFRLPALARLRRQGGGCQAIMGGPRKGIET